MLDPVRTDHLMTVETQVRHEVEASRIQTSPVTVIGRGSELMSVQGSDDLCSVQEGQVCVHR